MEAQWIVIGLIFTIVFAVALIKAFGVPREVVSLYEASKDVSLVGTGVFSMASRLTLDRSVDMPYPSSADCRYRVRFAGRWYACKPINMYAGMGLGQVMLADRRTHSRPILRPLIQIQQVS